MGLLTISQRLEKTHRRLVEEKVGGRSAAELGWVRQKDHTDKNNSQRFPP